VACRSGSGNEDRPWPNSRPVRGLGPRHQVGLLTSPIALATSRNVLTFREA
jgi:hypothetical protein